jgi:hypothetical protein
MRIKKYTFNGHVNTKEMPYNTSNHYSSLESVKDAIKNYLELKTSGALLLTGVWGSGKTHFLKNYVLPELDDQGQKSVVVSLYGENDIKKISRKILFSIIEKYKNISRSNTFLAKNSKYFMDALPFVKRYVDLEKFFFGEEDNIFNMLPQNEFFICFDDLERIGANVNQNDFLGFINDLVEKKNFKILLIANEPKLDSLFFEFKEKTIEKTIHFEVDMHYIIHKLIEEQNNIQLKNFILNNYDFFMDTILPTNIVDSIEYKEFSNSLSNIRTIKFSLEHFKYILNLLSKINKEGEELFNKKMKNIWAFVICICSEYKKPQSISYIDKKGLDVPVVTIADLDFDLLLSNSQSKQIDSINSENEKFTRKIRRLHFDRVKERYIYYSDIYNFITAGKKINVNEMVSNIDQLFNISEGQINPAHALLESFYREYWNRSEEAFIDDINNLYSYTINGKFNDVISHLNAANYLYDFKDSIGIDETELTNQIRKGISIHLSTNPKDVIELFRFRFIMSEFRKKEMQQLLLDVQQLLENYFNEQHIQLVMNHQNEFLANPSEFIDQYFMERGKNNDIIFSYDFSHFDTEKIEQRVPKWNASDVVKVALLLNNRYIEFDFPKDRFGNELPFVLSIEAGLSDIAPKSTSLLYNVLHRYLLPTIEKSKAKLS